MGKGRGDIGALDLSWNFLVGEYPKPAAAPAAIHYTNGGPWFENHVDDGAANCRVAESCIWAKSASG